MSRHNDSVYIAHMRDFLLSAQEISRGKIRADLDNDKMYRYAILHIVSVLGEAAGRLSPDFRSSHPEIPWGDIIGTRNRLIHGYDQVSLDLLWDTVTTDLPELLAQLDAILAE